MLQIFSVAFIISISHNVSLFPSYQIVHLVFCFFACILFFSIPVFFPDLKETDKLISNLHNNFLCHFVDLTQKKRLAIT